MKIGMPRWAAVLAVVAVLVTVVYVVTMFVGGGHGPDRHAPSGDVPSEAPSSTDAPGHRAPVEH